MKVRIQVIIEQENQKMIEEVACIEKQDLTMETLGLTVNEVKTMTSAIQKTMSQYQIEEYIAQQRLCPCCGKKQEVKGYHSLRYRTVFGKLFIKSPRLYACDCSEHPHRSFSPIALLLSERTSPELQYLESKWVSLMSYGMTTRLLEEVFPLDIHHSSVEYNTREVSTQLEQALGNEQARFIEGCQYDWEQLPKPDIPLIVGIDGGYIHAREGTNRKAGWFEAIVGKSLQEDRETKRFAYVVDYDTKPKRRLHEMLKKQGLQMNQAITFLSDGGETVQNLPFGLSPNSEHILDWFHITMKITVMKQLAKGIKDRGIEAEQALDRAKWYLWHGNVYKSLQVLEELVWDLDTYGDKEETHGGKLQKATEEFYEYIRTNRDYIPNYGERYRYGEAISSAFVESTVNEVISKRMVKKQQMRWTKKGAHLLLQLRVQTLNHELRQSFCQWYPRMEPEQMPVPLAA